MSNGKNKAGEEFLGFLSKTGKGFTRAVRWLIIAVLLYLGLLTVGTVVFSVSRGGWFSALIFGGVAAFFASVLIAGYAARQMIGMRQDYFQQIRENQDPVVPQKKAYRMGLLIYLPFDLVWAAVGLFIPVGGGAAWVATSVPALVFSGIRTIAVKERFKDLDAKIYPLVLTEIAIYLLTVAFGVFLLARSTTT